MSNTNLIARTVIFGLKDFADMMHYYLSNDSKMNVVAFTADAFFMNNVEEHKGLPVVDIEKLVELYPPDKHNLIIPVASPIIRRRTFEFGRLHGYTMPGYVSSKAIVNGSVGSNPFIQEFNNIQPFVQIGNNVVMWAGNHIGHHSIIEDDVTITSHCVISGHCKIERGAYLGVNCTIRDGVTIGGGAVIGMGAVVTKDVPPGVTVYGNPARSKEYKL